MIIETNEQKAKEDLKTKIITAYYAAVFQRTKNPYQDLQKVLDSIDKKEMTDEDLLREVNKLHQMFGGGR